VAAAQERCRCVRAKRLRKSEAAEEVEATGCEG
jgi:hypothetical protein